MSITILLVDDDAPTRGTVRAFLDAQPAFTVVGEAASGEEALAQAEALRPDVVVMDVVLPGLGGAEATRLILAALPATRVVALSFSTSRDFRDEMERAGASAFVTKDQVFEDLSSAIAPASVSDGDFPQPDHPPDEHQSERATREDWVQVNQRYLLWVLARVRGALERHAAGPESATGGPAPVASDTRTEALETLSPPPAIETLCATFDLSPFERDLILLCAGVELEVGFAALCAAAQGKEGQGHPTFSLALAALPEAYWGALSPAAPLRYWRLIEVRPGSALTSSALRLDESILHYLAGVPHLDERLTGIVEPAPEVGELAPSQTRLAERLATTWTGPEGVDPPVLQLCGPEVAAKRAIASTACARLGLTLAVVSARALPTNTTEVASLLRLWERESSLSGTALLLDCDELDTQDTASKGAIDHLIEHCHTLLVVTCRERRSPLQRAMLTFDVDKPRPAEQADLWRQALGPTAATMDTQIEELVAHFNLGAGAIRAACTGVASYPEDSPDAGPASPENLGRQLWDTCRSQARPRLHNLAQRIEPAATWDDLVLPAPQLDTLRQLALHVRQRARVYESWGFGGKSRRGLGIAALFAGASGTGKTMAAEVLARQLRLDLYRIDLSALVSKYIGETEKNLRRLFDAAEEGGAILLFDEADALFGKRSEVKDSHDRYANIEVSYLLQRMESYRGLAILTTNLKESLDISFMRRLRFIVSFPFPDATQRAGIWRHIFPAETPTADLDAAKLAQLNVAGGNIRNIALHAAFLAAEDDGPLTMAHLLIAARGEYAKQGKSVTEAEIRGWV